MLVEKHILDLELDSLPLCGCTEHGGNPQNSQQHVFFLVVSSYFTVINLTSVNHS